MISRCRKLLIGRITKRLHVEVRKVWTYKYPHIVISIILTHMYTHIYMLQEDNRLHVPVGTRLYKLEAMELSPDFS